MVHDNENGTRQRRTGTVPVENQNGSAKENGVVSEAQRGSGKTNRIETDQSDLLSVLLIWSPVMILIFGGCCSNVYTLESLVHASPNSGSLITALQFLLTTLFTLPHHFSISEGWRNLFLRSRVVPMRKWITYTAFFLTINMLNNYAFKYRISIPLHIILRSAGPVTTMAVGRIVGSRKYPSQKIFAVLLLFTGVVYAAYADAAEKQKQQSSFQTTSNKDVSSYLSQAPGFVIITIALILSALMGLYTDVMYAEHGHSTRVTHESLFYSHGLSLPFFMARLPSLRRELVVLTTSSQPISTYVLPLANLENTTEKLTGPLSSLLQVPSAVPLLVLNAITQYLCISGVNRLSAKSSSLTVGIVLNIRKLISLILSIWLFGNKLPVGVMIGAALVFVGGGVYALPTQRPEETASLKPTTQGPAADRKYSQQARKDL